MSPHVGLVEIYEGQSLDVLENISCYQQTATTRIGQINLSNVAVNDRLGVESQAGDEHLHLLRSRVLRLIQDYERIIQRATAHERNRRDFDHAFLQVSIYLLRLEHVVKRVVQRTQVRIDLVL